MLFRISCLIGLLGLAACGGGARIDPSLESAVAFTHDAQKYGYCYDVADANLCAENYCAQASGQTCQTLFRSGEQGYYVLALGNLGWGVGFSPSNRDAASQSAMRQCQQQTQGCREVESWQADGVR